MQVAPGNVLGLVQIGSKVRIAPVWLVLCDGPLDDVIDGRNRFTSAAVGYDD